MRIYNKPLKEMTDEELSDYYRSLKRMQLISLDALLEQTLEHEIYEASALIKVIISNIKENNTDNECHFQKLNKILKENNFESDVW